MVKLADRILDHLRSTGKVLCDQCLCEALGLKYPQQAQSRCSTLARGGRIVRDRFALCDRCKKHKIGNASAKTNTSSARLDSVSPVAALDVVRAVSRTGDAGGPSKPWFWEGHVQGVLVAWLQNGGWSVTEHANTAVRAPGKDIKARRGDRELWVSVKGYPEGTPRTNPSTQARHWFAHAAFDLACYRTEQAGVDLAMGLPRRGVTYERLAARSRWLFEQLRAKLFWIAESGEVEEHRFETRHS